MNTGCTVGLMSQGNLCQRNPYTSTITAEKFVTEFDYAHHFHPVTAMPSVKVIIPSPFRVHLCTLSRMAHSIRHWTDSPPKRKIRTCTPLTYPCTSVVYQNHLPKSSRADTSTHLNKKGGKGLSILKRCSWMRLRIGFFSVMMVLRDFLLDGVTRTRLPVCEDATSVWQYRLVHACTTLT